MVMPAPKSLDDVIDALNECTVSGHKLGDMERYHIKKRLEEVLQVLPGPALVCFGILATLDRDETAMRKYFQRAFSYRRDLEYININYAVSLMKFGCADEASVILANMLQDEMGAVKYLDEIAFAALEIDNDELSEKILRLADKLKMHTENLHFLALHMSLALADSPGAEVELLKNFLSDETLKKNSVPLTPDEWGRMQNFADELKQYL